tara:strand:+ start:1279 stop:1989 length:711 start_codon:yes stop_codon:yes gene_type:complete
MTIYQRIKKLVYRKTYKLFYKHFHQDNLYVLNKHANNAEKKTWNFINKNLDLFKKIIINKITILETGCVNGRNLIISGRKDVNYIGLDLNQKAINIGKSFLKSNKKNNISLHCGNLNTFKIKNINLLVNICLCIYLNKDELNSYFRKIIIGKVDIIIFVDSFSKKNSFNDYYYQHSLNEFSIFKEKYISITKTFLHEAWRGPKSTNKFIFLIKKNLINNIEKNDYLILLKNLNNIY